MTAKSDKPEHVLAQLLERAKSAGATSADAMLIDAASVSIGFRLGKVETLERSESGDLGLRVFIGKQQAIVSTTDRRQETLDELVTRAVAMAKLAPEDPFCGIGDASQITKSWPEVDMADGTAEPSISALIQMAKEAEDAALAVKGVTNSEGGDVGLSHGTYTIATSNGFKGSYRRTSVSLSASVIAGEGTNMERDYDYASRVFLADMPSASSIGTEAAKRAVRRLNARKMPTCHVPVVFEPRVAGGLIGQLSSAISGASVARGTSFLKDKLGQTIFPTNITIIDDPFRARGLRSRPFDAEGILPKVRNVIEKGVLTTWLLDLRSARQLNMATTAHASRSPGGTPSPSPSNMYMEPGPLSPADLIKDIKEGFYVTELMGMGVNGVTGDYSQAAAGFWIENGQITFPVNEMTIASNLKEMFLHLTPANDLAFIRGIDAPTIRVEGMTTAGL